MCYPEHWSVVYVNEQYLLFFHVSDQQHPNQKFIMGVFGERECNSPFSLSSLVMSHQFN